MLRRLIFPLLLGLGGCAILVGLGSWQLGRLQWKQAILVDIDRAIAANPVPLPEDGSGAERYLPVMAAGDIGPQVLRVLVSRKQIGPGYRVITSLDLGTRRVMVDLGFIREGQDMPAIQGPAVITGNLHLPVEIDSYTPVPDLDRNIWFARDVPAMAAALRTEPVLIVARAPVVGGIEPMPVDTSTIPNDHLQYAITWFLLATVWAGMTGLLIWRISQRKT